MLWKIVEWLKAGLGDRMVLSSIPKTLWLIALDELVLALDELVLALDELVLMPSCYKVALHKFDQFLP